MPDKDQETCDTCGTEGTRCYGNDDQGPEHPDWIGKSAGRECCHACHKDKSS